MFFCIAASFILATNAGERELLEDGSTVDEVCLRTWELAKEIPELHYCLSKPARKNSLWAESGDVYAGTLSCDDEIVLYPAFKKLLAKCRALSSEEPELKQCAFYLDMILQEDWGLLVDWYKEASDDAMYKTCGAVVNYVNQMPPSVMDFDIQKDIFGGEYFVEYTSEVMRRLMAAGLPLLVSGASVLARVCRSYNTITNELLSL